MMKPRSAIVIAALLTLSLLFTIDHVNAITIDVSINAESGGIEIMHTKKGTTVQLVSSCSVTPPVPLTGAISYIYSNDNITWSSKTNITTYTTWNGAERSTDFILANTGYYVFFLDIVTEGPPPYISATVYSSSSGVYSEELMSPVPEAPTIIAVLTCFAAVGLFVLMAKRRK